LFRRRLDRLREDRDRIAGGSEATEIVCVRMEALDTAQLNASVQELARRDHEI
jgi:hypothetical protein